MKNGIKREGGGENQDRNWEVGKPLLIPNLSTWMSKWKGKDYVGIWWYQWMECKPHTTLKRLWKATGTKAKGGQQRDSARLCPPGVKEAHAGEKMHGASASDKKEWERKTRPDAKFLGHERRCHLPGLSEDASLEESKESHPRGRGTHRASLKDRGRLFPPHHPLRPRPICRPSDPRASLTISTLAALSSWAITSEAPPAAAAAAIMVSLQWRAMQCILGRGGRPANPGSRRAEGARRERWRGEVVPAPRSGREALPAGCGGGGSGGSSLEMASGKMAREQFRQVGAERGGCGHTARPFSQLSQS